MYAEGHRRPADLAPEPGRPEGFLDCQNFHPSVSTGTKGNAGVDMIGPKRAVAITVISSND